MSHPPANEMVTISGACQFHLAFFANIKKRPPDEERAHYTALVKEIEDYALDHWGELRSSVQAVVAAWAYLFDILLTPNQLDEATYPFWCGEINNLVRLLRAELRIQGPLQHDQNTR